MPAPKLDGFLRALRSPEAAARLAAAKAIGNAAVDGAKGDGAIGPLATALVDPDPAVRVAAAWALSGFAAGGAELREAGRALVAAVLKGSPDERHWAAAALSAAMRRGSGEKLEEALLKDFGALKTAGRKASLAALRGSGSDLFFALAPLAALAADADMTVREWAIETLKDVAMPDPVAMKKLGELLGTSLAAGASAGLARVAYRGGPLGPAVPALERLAGTEGPPSVGTALMAHHLRSPGRVAVLLGTADSGILAAALRFLNRPETPAASLAAAAPSLQPLLDHKGKNVRAEAATALATIAHRSGDKASREALLRHKKADVRTRAQFVLEELASG